MKPASAVRSLRRRDGDRCHWCGIALLFNAPEAEWRRATLDHLLPRSFGGTNALVNLVLACGRCNRRRGATPVDEWETSRYLANRRLEVVSTTGRGLAA